MTNEAQVPDMGMDANALFREEVYTDGLRFMKETWDAAG